MTLGRSDVGTEELDVVVLEGVDVVVVAPVKEVVVDEGRVVVGEFRLAWPEPPPHAARVATTARARTVPIDFIGHGRRLIGTVCAARVTTLQSVGALRGSEVGRWFGRLLLRLRSRPGHRGGVFQRTGLGPAA